MKKILLFGISVLMAAPGIMEARTLESSVTKLERKADLKTAKDNILRIPNQHSNATRAISYDQPSGVWTEWEVFGTGTLTLSDIFDLYEGDLESYDGSYPDLTLYHREDANNSSVQQFKLEGVFNDAELIIDYYPELNQLLKISPQPTNTSNFFGDVDVMDFASAYEVLDMSEDYGMTQEEYDELVQYYNDYNYYVPSLGRLYIYLGFMVPGDFDVCGLGDFLFQLDGVEDFTPVFADDTFFSPDNAEISVNFPSSVTIKYLIAPGYNLSAMLDNVLEGGEGVEILNESGKISLSSAEPNLLYYVMAVSYSSEGEALELAYKEFTIIDDETTEWTSLGQTSVTTDVLEGLFGVEPSTYQCEIQEKITQPGVYRFVNLFTSAYPWNDEGEYDTNYNHYIIVDASDPDFVTIPAQIMGNDWGGGYFSFESAASYYMGEGYEKDQVTLYAGQLKDGVITFPVNGFLVSCPVWSVFGGEDGSLYYGNTDGTTAFVIPELVDGIKELFDSLNDNKPKYYNLQGIEIKDPKPGTILIEKRGNIVKKLVF